MKDLRGKNQPSLGSNRRPLVLKSCKLTAKLRGLSEYSEKKINPQEASKAELELAAPGFQVLHLTNRASALRTASI